MWGVKYSTNIFRQVIPNALAGPDKLTRPSIEFRGQGRHQCLLRSLERAMRQPGRESKRRRGYGKTLSANEPRWFEPANLRLEKEKGGGTSQVLSKRIEKQTTKRANQVDKTTSHLAKTERGELHGHTAE